MEIISNSESQTQKIARDFAKMLKKGDIIALYGELGAGKTVFAKGLAQGLGIKDRITSPTFTFQKTYKKGRLILHHLDLYRGESLKDFEALALDEIFSNDAVTLIEWAQKIDERLPKKRIEVIITPENETKRRVTITRYK
jgi:tRNA threonylcarbamoyladenosine biosynthesis protein TsaE